MRFDSLYYLTLHNTHRLSIPDWDSQVMLNELRFRSGPSRVCKWLRTNHMDLTQVEFQLSASFCWDLKNPCRLRKITVIVQYEPYVLKSWNCPVFKRYMITENAQFEVKVEYGLCATTCSHYMNTVFIFVLHQCCSFLYNDWGAVHGLQKSWTIQRKKTEVVGSLQS